MLASRLTDSPTATSRGPLVPNSYLTDATYGPHSHHRPSFFSERQAPTLYFLNRQDRLFQPRALEIGNDRQQRRAIALSMATIGNTGAPRVFNCCWTSCGLLVRQTNFTAIIVSRLLTTTLPCSLLPLTGRKTVGRACATARYCTARQISVRSTELFTGIERPALFVGNEKEEWNRPVTDVQSLK